MTSGAQRYREISDQVGAVQLLLDPTTGDIVEANPAAEQFYGYPRAELERLRITDINTLPPQDVLQALDLAASVGSSRASGC
jgi:PAS domain S-box-containing protein